MTSLHLALSAAGAIGALLELPRTVRSLAARVDRLIRYEEDLMVELAEAKEAQRVAEEAMDQRDRQWQLVLDSRVNAAEQKGAAEIYRLESLLSSASNELFFFRLDTNRALETGLAECERLRGELAQVEATAKVADHEVTRRDTVIRQTIARAEKAEAEAASATERAKKAEAELERLYPRLSLVRKRAEQAESRISTLKEGGPSFVEMGEAYDKDTAGPVQFAMAQWRVGYAAGLAFARKVTP